ncbi:sulfate reduction electron transfer complex DsrMKJOP subunit DsrP, partial [Gordonibacter pamelaeae]
MLEKALRGSKGYYAWVGILLLGIVAGVAAYANQLANGLTLTGMSRDVSWGLYISQFVFLVGVAASGVMVAIPYYLHHFKTYAKIVVIGEFMAVAAVLTAVLFIVVDLGQPMRVLNVILFPTPNSILFWDMCVLSSYLVVNLVIGWTVLGAEKKGFPPPRWTHVLSIIAIPLAIGIHTVTAFLISGLAGREYWLTAIMAARFLASAFAAGPALLIVLCLVLRKTARFNVTDKAIDSLAKTVCYAMIANVFFFVLEVFTAFYSNMPGHKAPIEYLFFGLDGHAQLVPVMWLAAVLAIGGILLLLVPKLRRSHKVLVPALAAVFFACLIDKGLGLVLGGFVPNSFEQVVEYIPNPNELLVIVGVYSIGALA